MMATVKGDVHDIGKNIVGVVLQCNDYEVIDLGVMMPTAKILETASRGADIIGLSGLITPSLDEMIYVAGEMERQGFDYSAPDRRCHHEPRPYRGQDRSRTTAAARSCTSMTRAARSASRPACSPRRRAAYVADIRDEYEKICRGACRAGRREAPDAQRARANAVKIDFAKAPPKPDIPRLAEFRQLRSRRARALYRLDAVLPDLGTGRTLSRHPHDEKVGEAARALYDDAQKMLTNIVDEKWITARAAIGFWPANADGDDIVGLWRRGTQTIETLHTLRQQIEKREGRPNLALSDFIAPQRRARLYRRLRRHRRYRRGRIAVRFKNGQ